MAFNIDPVTWKTFTSPSPSQSQNVAFGYKVIQKDTSLIVSDPLIQVNQAQRGLIYDCAVAKGTCSSLKIDVPSEAVNMSLGLSMVQDPQSSKLAICGPTIPKKCVSVTNYRGMCFIREKNNVFKAPIPQSKYRDCLGQIDIAFLLDGSGSVGRNNFITMKNFVTNVIKHFTERDAQFAIAQYSSGCVIHYNFNQLKIQDSTWESNVTNIQYQYGGSTMTATAISKLVRELFTPNGGVRPSANKILLVITDGQSHDRKNLARESSEANAKNIKRFAIGVGNAFNSDEAIRELATIASSPSYNHVFRVNDFDALENIHEKLKENIIAIEGTQTSGDSSRMELAQDGFSAAFTSNADIIMTAVGAFQSKGGYRLYKPNDNPDDFQAGSEHDSYLGYSLAIATMSGAKYAVMGAPRHKHKGQVTVSGIDGKYLKQLDSPKVVTLIFV